MRPGHFRAMGFSFPLNNRSHVRRLHKQKEPQGEILEFFTDTIPTTDTISISGGCLSNNYN